MINKTDLSRPRCHQRLGSSSNSRSQGSTSHSKRSRRSHPRHRQSPHRRRESHLAPQTGGQEQGQDPRAGVGILAVQAATSLPEDSHLNIINDPIHQNVSVKSIHALQIPGEDVNWIRSSIQANLEIQFDLKLEMSLIVKTLKFVQCSSF